MTPDPGLSDRTAGTVAWQRFRAVLVGLGIAIGLAAAMFMIVGLALLGQLLALTLRTPGC